MKDVSFVQKLITWTVIISLLIIGVSVFLQKDEVTPVVTPKEYTPVPTSGPAPIPVYPNNGKE